MPKIDISLSEDCFTCSVCLDLLAEPVTTACGHSFCKPCISGYWDSNDVCKCPHCRQLFALRPALQKNVILTGIVEKLKKRGLISSLSENYARPHDVPCDVCSARKLRAVQSCLTCLSSYCEIHFRPHRESEALKKHKLFEPTGNLQQRLCSQHQRLLEVFCATDQVCICYECAAHEHRNHNVMTLENGRAEKRSQLEKTKKAVKKSILGKQEQLEEMRQAVQKIQVSAEREVQECEEAFGSLLQSIKTLRSEVTVLIREYQQREVRKAEELIERIEVEIEELKRKDASIIEFLKTEDQIYFLQKFPSVCTHLGDEDPLNINVGGDFLSEALRKNLCDVKKHLRDTSLWEVVKIAQTGVEAPVYSLQNPAFVSRRDLLKYFCHLTMDPSTAHKNLSLSDGNRTVIQRQVGRSTFIHLTSFEQVLCSGSLCGPYCYWEVEWRANVDIGVTHKGINRKKTNEECRLGRSDRSWGLSCEDGRYSAWHNNTRTDILAPCFNRVGVYLDYPARSLSLYSITDKVSLLHRFTVTLKEPLWPGFCIGPASGVTICLLN
ncbi:E3 ubiquitin/ISG15 ligase TRIM25-like [Erpetoichthys calabaricus]|uniref:E3 ubiquitin/ISG15 ligase TRIM25-like n=1 Tax=Erpetoichthys calabaricus TaxID=27687 RepID=A0A8C4T1T5_ERPCA|nr:E3 ubiquitin/ISG15 ligase TRIM25-like [Erpetoichthys calabaricus]